MVLIAGSIKELQNLLDEGTTSEDHGLYINSNKTKVQKIIRNNMNQPQEHILVNDEKIENVNDCLSWNYDIEFLWWNGRVKEKNSHSQKWYNSIHDHLEI